MHVARYSAPESDPGLTRFVDGAVFTDEFMSIDIPPFDLSYSKRRLRM